MSAVAPGVNDGAGASAGMSASLAGSSPTEITSNAALPARLTSLVLAVSGKRGFWRHERTEIARELCGHFLDGLEAGRTPDQLAASFGEPGRTARLMLRAKRRNRPLAWRAAMMTVRALFIFFCTVIVVYGVLAARFWSGSPTLAHNYLKEFNAPIVAIPAADRAWPEYRAVVMAMGVRGEVESAVAAEGLDEPAEGQGDVRFKATSAQRVAFIRSIRPLLDRVRAASLKPALGYVAGTTNDEELAAATTANYTPPSVVSVQEENPNIVSVLLPSLGYARQFVRLLKSDALLAAREGDGARSAQSVLAMLRVARHSKEFPCLISDLVSVALMQSAAGTLGTLMEAHAATISDGDLLQVSHAFGTFNGGAPFELSLSGEQAMFDDLLQRAFTDDGRGNGRLTPQAMRLLAAMQSDGTNRNRDEGGLGDALGPVAMVAMADRASQRREYAAHMNALREWLATPPWLRGDESPDIGPAAAPDPWRARYMPVSIMLPALTRTGWSLERAAFERDAVCAAIAIELHKRRTGAYPAALADVGSMLLPKMPVDPFDGKPIKYRLVQGAAGSATPVLYSIGVDRKDDGGVLPPPVSGWEEPRTWLGPGYAASYLKAATKQQGSSIDGDWIVWPPSKQKRPE